MMKQDCEFSTEKEARDFYNKVWSDAHNIERSLLEGACTTFLEASESWEELAISCDD